MIVRLFRYDGKSGWLLIDLERVVDGKVDVRLLEKMAKLYNEALDILYDIEEADETFNNHQALEVIENYSSITVSLDELLSDLGAYFEGLAFIHREE